MMHFFLEKITVEPVYNDPVLSGRPLLSGKFSCIFYLY